MSLENALAEHAKAILALTAAIERNTEAGLKVLDARTTTITTAAPNITAAQVKEVAETLAEEQEAVEQEAAEEKPAKAPAKKKAAPKKKAEPDPEPEPEVDEELDDDLDDAPTVTMDDVKKAAIKLRDAMGKDALEKVKASLKTGPVKDMDPKLFAAFIRQCEAQLDEEV